MQYFIGLALALVGIWAAWSGIFEPLIMGFGAVSILITLILTHRLGLIDQESVPYFRLFALLPYYLWLFVEIIKANLVVIRACLKADLDIYPALVKVRTNCRSDLAKTIFANSITLTPGTVTLAVDGDMILVHALYEDAAEPEAFIDMDRRTAWAVEGTKARTQR